MLYLDDRSILFEKCDTTTSLMRCRETWRAYIKKRAALAHKQSILPSEPATKLVIHEGAVEKNVFEENSDEAPRCHLRTIKFWNVSEWNDCHNSKKEPSVAICTGFEPPTGLTHPTVPVHVHAHVCMYRYFCRAHFKHLKLYNFV